jgi:putative NAD(P)-binding protein
MGKPRQRAVDILGLQHQSRRCGSRASGCTSKETIANGGRAVRFHANLNHGGNQRSHGHRVRRNWVSRPPHRSAPARSRIPVRIASRHPDRGHRLFGPDDPQLQSVSANIHDGRSVADALVGAYGVVKVSLYVEHGQETFHSVHVEAARRVAAQALRAGVVRFIHISGIGADAASQSRYIQKRGEGELAVRAAFGGALRRSRSKPRTHCLQPSRSSLKTPRHISRTFASRTNVVIGDTHMKRC